MEEHWTLAVYIWLPISIIITLVLIWVLNWGLQEGFKRGFRSAAGYGIAHWYSSLWTVVVAGALLALFVPLNLIGWIPYKKEYHQWQTHSGVVEQITQVQLGQDWVVKFEGDDNKYNCAETRCGTIKRGGLLAISCVKKVVWGGTDSYNCKYLRDEPENIDGGD